MDIWRDYTFSAAHRLTELPDGHRCRRVHGHNYRVRITYRGPARFSGVGAFPPHTGVVLDFAEIDAAWTPLAEQLDHQDLNDILEQPTCERVAEWIWSRLPWKPGTARLYCVEVCESDRSGARYYGPAA